MAAPNTCPITRVLSGLALGDVIAMVCSHYQPPARSSSITISAMTVRLRFDIVPRST